MHATLAEIREAAERKFGDYPIDLGEGRTLVLRNALRLPADERKQVGGLHKALADAGNAEDPLGAQVDAARDMFRLLASRQDDAEVLIEAVGDDLPTLLEIIGRYNAVARPGEASPSGS